MLSLEFYIWYSRAGEHKAQIGHIQQGSTNCTHGDKHADNMHSKEVFICTKLCAHKSFKTLLISTWMLFKVVSCFCV